MTYIPYRVPVSVKGIVFEDDKVWLRKNERNEWELPGGKLDAGEQPTTTVARELLEELGFATEVVSIIDAHLYTIQLSTDENKGVLVVSYLCELIDKVGDFEHIGEAGHAEFVTHGLEEIGALVMPQFYMRAIQRAFAINQQFKNNQ